MFKFIFIFLVLSCCLCSNSFGNTDSLVERKVNFGVLFEFLGSGGVGSINLTMEQKLSNKTNLNYRIGGIYYLSKPTLSGQRIPMASIPILMGYQYGNKIRVSAFSGFTYWSGWYQDERRTTNQRTLATEPGKRDYLTSIFLSIGLEISFQISKQVSFACGINYLKYLLEINERSLGKYSFYPQLKENEYQERRTIQEILPLFNLKVKLQK